MQRILAIGFFALVGYGGFWYGARDRPLGPAEDAAREFTEALIGGDYRTAQRYLLPNSLMVASFRGHEPMFLPPDPEILRSLVAWINNQPGGPVHSVDVKTLSAAGSDQIPAMVRIDFVNNRGESFFSLPFYAIRGAKTWRFRLITALPVNPTEPPPPEDPRA